MKDSIKMQTRVLLNKKSTIIIYFFMLILILINYSNNLITYYGRDIMAMFHPMKLLLLSPWSKWVSMFTRYFPLLVIIPASFSYLSDRNTRETVFIQSRIGRKHYYWGKFISVFLVTFLVFAVPMLLEVILNCIAIPFAATGDPSNVDNYALSYINSVDQYFLPELFKISVYGYAIVMILIASLVSAVLAVFALAVSTLSLIRFNILLFLPVYTILYVLGMLQTFFNMEIETDYAYYLHMYEIAPKSGWAYVSVLLLFFISAVVMIAIKVRRDEVI